ncbi:MAG: polyprenyl synthetase family protein [Erysipelothrix sp.]|nr:polyprenyl synthetase family protein [Erysipelothrix sp.]
MLESFEKFLNEYNYGPKGKVLDAVKYSVLNPGKRIRPMILLTILNDYQIDYKKGFSPALAIEMIHNYSLIHDDLPAMDNDDYRRGKLSTHKVYGEDIAILAGDALLTMAFNVISNDKCLDSDIKVKLISLLSKHAGIEGMIYGQQLDLTFEGKNIDITKIDEINIYKTSNLIIFSMLAAAIIANKEEDLIALEVLATKLGLAFQIQDDIFDVTKSFEEIGKKPSDQVNDKSTYVKVLGLEKSSQVLDDLFIDCYKIIKNLSLKNHGLKNLVQDIQNRIN